MDVPALDTLNAMLGNASSCAILECALSAGELELGSPITFAVGGAPGLIQLNGRDVEPWRSHAASAGDRLLIGAPESGRFRYVAFAGGIDCPVVMRSRSTYIPGRIGGIDGRRLKAGDAVATASASRKRRHQVSDQLPEALRPPFAAHEIRFVARNDVVIPREWKISPSSDRTGYRLETDAAVSGGSITSEPVCPGTIQLPPGGEAIVLMADAPTVGGYLIGGAVISADLGALAQRAPGEPVSFSPVTIADAQRAVEREAERIESVRQWSLG